MSRIHIFGASGSGTTTLGKTLAARLRCLHFDTDDYFWLPSDPPFQHARERQMRLEMLFKDLENTDSWVLSGSLCDWGDSLIGLFDIAVYLWISHDLRMSRLKAREIERYSEEIVCPNGVWRKQTQEFLDWAAEYDTGGLEIRSYELHEAWIESLPCPILQIRGDIPIGEKVERVITKIRIGFDNDNES